MPATRRRQGAAVPEALGPPAKRGRRSPRLKAESPGETMAAAEGVQRATPAKPELEGRMTPVKPELEGRTTPAKPEPEGRAPGAPVDDREGMVYGFAGEVMSEYEFTREAQLRRNRNFLDALGLGATKAGLGAIATAQKAVSGPSRRGLKARRAAREPAGPPRRSARNRGEAADDLQVEGERGGRITVGRREAGAAGKATSGTAGTALPEEPRKNSRMPDGPLTLASTNASEESGKAFLESLRRLSAEAEAAGQQGADAPVPLGALALAERFADLQVDQEEQVCKVVPDRIYGLAVHPSSAAVVVAAGDKQGNLGIWNASRKVDADDEDDGVVIFRPHTRPISRLQYSADGGKLYSWSYDGNVRVMDLEKNEFSHVHKTPDADAGWLQSGCLPPAAPMELYTCDSQGAVKLFDIRSGAAVQAWAKNLHDKKINTVDVSPSHDHLFATCGLDRCVKLWDRRNLGAAGSANPPKRMLLATLPLNRSVSSALFSCDGEYLLSTSMCNKLNLYAKPYAIDAKDPAPTYSTKHDNQTGRWLSVFQATWHPTQPGIFACGSMQQPRCIEVFSTENQGRRIMNIQGDYLGSVHSRNVFHPTLDVIVGGNSSGRCTVAMRAGAR